MIDQGAGIAEPNNADLLRGYAPENFVFATFLAAGPLSGCILSNNAADAVNDIDIAAGYTLDSTKSDIITVPALTKRLDAAWAVGTNQGGRDTGAIANNTYHVHAIKSSSTGVVDALFYLSPTAPTLPTGYDLFSRIGSILRVGATILAFIQDENEFRLGTPILDVNVVNPGAAAVTRTISVPTGIRVEALLGVAFSAATAADTPASVYISDLALTNIAAGLAPFSVKGFTAAVGRLDIGAQVRCFTDTAAQVRTRLQISAAGTTFYMSTLGWTDRRRA